MSELLNSEINRVPFKHIVNRLQQIWDGHGVLEKMNCLIPWRDHSQHSRTEPQKISPLCHNQIRLVFLDINTKQFLYIQRTKGKGFLFGNSAPSFNGSLVYLRLAFAPNTRLSLGKKKLTQATSKGKFRADQILSQPIPTTTLFVISSTIELFFVIGGPGKLMKSWADEAHGMQINSSITSHLQASTFPNVWEGSKS